MDSKETKGTKATTVIAGERYRCAELVFTRLDGESRLVYAKDTGVWRVLPHQRADALARCNVFDTLENHARARCRDFGLGDAAVDTIRGRLTELAEAGLLIGYRALREQCQATTRPSAKTKINTVGIVTRDRQPILERGLTSIIANARRYGRRPSLIVMDDTEKTSVQKQCRAGLRALAKQHGAAIGYANLAAKKTFVSVLAKESGVPAAVVKFALNGPVFDGARVGANRNALLLETAGEMFFSMDDDVVAEVASPPDAEPGLRFFTEPDPAEYWFYPDQKSARAAVQFVEKDLLGLQEQLLGKRLADCFAAVPTGESLNLNRLTSDWARRSARGEGRVRLTMAGLVGDCGLSWPRWYVLSGQTHQRLVQSESVYRTAFVSREVLRATRMTAIGSGSFFMSYANGVDNRAVLPPVFPVGRGADGLFGRMTQMISPDTMFAHLPWAVIHGLETPRTFPPHVVRADASGRDLTYCIGVCVGQCSIGPGEQTEAERLASLGRQLAGWAALPSADFAEWLRLTMWGEAERELRTIEGWLQTRTDAPVYWAADLREHHRTLAEAMRRPEYVAPRELHPGRTPAVAVELLRRWLGQFGELLQAWPELWKAAGRLRKREKRLALRP